LTYYGLFPLTHYYSIYQPSTIHSTSRTGFNSLTLALACQREIEAARRAAQITRSEAGSSQTHAAIFNKKNKRMLLSVSVAVAVSGDGTVWNSLKVSSH